MILVKRIVTMLLVVVAGVVSMIGQKDMSSYSYTLSSFESIIEYATHIVVGTCTDVTSTDYAMLYEFSVESQFKGTSIENEIIYVRVFYEEKQPEHAKNGKIHNSYEIGKRYLLIMERFLDAYNVYAWEGLSVSTVIPLYELENMYIHVEKHNLWEWSDMTLLDVINEKTFLNYVKKEIAKEPVPRKNYVGTLYAQSDDLETILQSSENVFRIKVGEKCGEGEWNEEYSCEILEQYKGTADLTKQYRIDLLCDHVSEGEEYIVALTKCFNRHGIDGDIYTCYDITSKNSIISVEKEEEVRNILVNGE